MKNQKWAALFALVTFVALAFTACEGPMGPAGADGAAGTDGTVGAAGQNGTSFVWKGTYANEAAFLAENPNPQDGWAYYNTSEGKALIYYSLATPPWQTLAADGTNGQNGSNGDTPYIGGNGNWWIGSTDTGIKAEGADGTIFLWKGTYEDETAFETDNGTPQDGWAYYDEALKQSRIYSDGAWDTLTANGADGTDGQDGTVFVWKGTYEDEAAFETDNGTPQDGWAYYDEALKQSRIYNDSAWHTLTAQGEQGETGLDGTIFVWKGSYANATVFIATNGPPQDGWAYYNEELKQSLIYSYSDGEWQTLTAQGEPGNTPYVGDNGNWWIGGIDTGVLVNGVASISISGTFKTGYFQHESFTSAGLVVTIHYTDGSIATLNSGYHLFWDYQPLRDGNYGITAETGTKTVTVSWHEYTDEYVIQVFEPSDNFYVYDTATWNYALSEIANGGNNQSYVIEVFGNANVGVAGTTSNSFGNVSNVQVTLIGEGKLYLTSQGNLIRIGSNQTVIIDSEDLTLEGLTNGQNGSTTDNNEAVVNVNGGGTLELRNGTISGNSASGNGSGVYVGYNSNFTMSGGTISGNTASNSGGGVTVNYGNFTMSGGSISGNTASYGGGVSVSSGNFTMSGGSISGNTSSSYGGGVYVSDGNFTMSGGSISGNSTSNQGGGVYVSSGTSFTKASETTGGNSGVISGNTATTSNGQQVRWASSPVRYVNDPLGETDELSTSDPASGWLSQ